MPKVFDVELDDEQLQAQQEHLRQGGLFVPVPDEPPEVLTDVRLRIRTPHGSAELDAQVVQVIPGAGVGLMVDVAEAAAKLADLQEGAGDAEGPAVDNMALRIQRMTSDEKRDLAKHGDRTARMALMRDTNKATHLYVLQNQQLTLDELRLMVGLRNVNPQVLAKVSQNRQWMRDRGVVMALVGNPKTPANVAKRALDTLTAGELRRLIKLTDIPPHVISEAKQRLQKLLR